MIFVCEFIFSFDYIVFVHFRSFYIILKTFYTLTFRKMTCVCFYKFLRAFLQRCVLLFAKVMFVNFRVHSFTFTAFLTKTIDNIVFVKFSMTLCCIFCLYELTFVKIASVCFRRPLVYFLNIFRFNIC
jgi:hypothetical protein